MMAKNTCFQYTFSIIKKMQKIKIEFVHNVSFLNGLGDSITSRGITSSSLRVVLVSYLTKSIPSDELLSDEIESNVMFAVPSCKETASPVPLIAT